IGQESPEGYRISLREVIRVADFMKEHQRLLKPNEALAWAMREIYYRKLQTWEDREIVRGIISNMKSLQGLDIESIFGQFSIDVSDIRNLIERYGYAAVYFMYHSKGKQLDEVRFIFDNIISCFDKKNPGNSTMNIPMLANFPPDFAFKVIDLAMPELDDAVLPQFYKFLFLNSEDRELKAKIMDRLKDLAVSMSTMEAACNVIIDLSDKMGDMDKSFKKSILEKLKGSLTRNYGGSSGYLGIKAYCAVNSKLEDENDRTDYLNVLVKMLDDDNIHWEVKDAIVAAIVPVVSSLEDDSYKMEVLKKIKLKTIFMSVKDTGISSFLAIALSLKKEGRIKLFNELAEPYISEKISKADIKDIQKKWYGIIAEVHIIGRLARSLLEEKEFAGMTGKLTSISRNYKKLAGEIGGDYPVLEALESIAGIPLADHEYDAAKKEAMDYLEWVFAHEMFSEFQSSVPMYGAIGASFGEESEKVKRLDSLTVRYEKDGASRRPAILWGFNLIASSLKDEAEKIKRLDWLMKLWDEKTESGLVLSIAQACMSVSSSLGSDAELRKVEVLDRCSVVFFEGEFAGYNKDGLVKSYYDIIKSLKDRGSKIRLLDKFLSAKKAGSYLLDIAYFLASEVNDGERNIKLMDKCIDALGDQFARGEAFRIGASLSASIDDQARKKRLYEKSTRLFGEGGLTASTEDVGCYNILVSSILSPYKETLASLYQTNHAHFIETYGTNITQVKASPYDIEVDEEHKVIKGKVNGSIVVEQPIL
ncbi:MAG: hypothetical protein NTZ95_06680, partial [Candidatus Omnitrophica bacterium]|nr:hypothetical protein [Candidatus Omnitrophota bacterium]